MTCWDVLHWPPERVTLEWTCMLAWRDRRRRALTTPDAETGRPPSVMLMMDVNDA